MRFWLLAAVCVCSSAWATQPRVDFDVVIEALKTSGTWEENATLKFVYTPTVAQGWAPYRQGQWLYTDYGWTWQGADGGSWATDHYGYWTKRGAANGGWVWVPGGFWLPSAVEWLRSGDYLGWRASRLDRFSNPLEPESARYGDPSEWNFVPAEKLRGTLTAADFASLDKTKDLLMSAQPVDHTFASYRPIDRPGPDPSILKSPDANAAPVIPNVSDLPALGAAPDAKTTPKQYYIYRPRFFQDEDGILRRVELYLNPRAANIEELIKPKVDPQKEADAIRKQEELQEKQRKHNEALYR